MNEKTKERPVRPFSMDYTEAKNKIIGAVNEATQIHGVPLYLLGEILENVLHQVKSGAKAECDKARSNFEKQMAEYEKAEE